MQRSLLYLALSAILLSVGSPVVASAYTDPGSGTFAYQAAYAAFLAGTFYLRRILDRIWGRRK